MVYTDNTDSFEELPKNGDLGRSLCSLHGSRLCPSAGGKFNIKGRHLGRIGQRWRAPLCQRFERLAAGLAIARSKRNSECRFSCATIMWTKLLRS
jgi:hypothetical protein